MSSKDDEALYSVFQQCIYPQMHPHSCSTHLYAHYEVHFECQTANMVNWRTVEDGIAVRGYHKVQIGCLIFWWVHVDDRHRQVLTLFLRNHWVVSSEFDRMAEPSLALNYSAWQPSIISLSPSAMRVVTCWGDHPEVIRTAIEYAVFLLMHQGWHNYCSDDVASSE